MPNRRTLFSDALARLKFRKPLNALSETELADLEFLRALDGDAADEQSYEKLVDTPAVSADATVH